MSNVDPRLSEIFDYYFGVDINLDKHAEGRRELADFFVEWIKESFEAYGQVTDMEQAKPKSQDKVNSEPPNHSCTAEIIAELERVYDEFSFGGKSEYEFGKWFKAHLEKIKLNNKEK